LALPVTDAPRASDWRAFYDAVAGRPPHETAIEALDRFSSPGFAVDLGCGDGRDTVAMLERGWRVLAIDGQAQAIERLRERIGDHPALETQAAEFHVASWPDAELVNAGFSLPFCPAEHFPTVWARVVESLRPGGRFSGHLFGPNDEWVGTRLDNVQSREEALELLDGFDLERFDEVEADGQTATGTEKHWHVFHVVARRRGDGLGR
jgi:SAM-dependent methyltransferase